MPASTIAHVLLRLFALSWILRGFAGLPQILLWSSSFGFQFTAAIPSVLYLIAGFVGWILAPVLGLMIAGKSDDTPTFPNVSSLQLNTTMIVGLGIYFIMSRFADVFGWLHFFAINRSPEYGFHREVAPSYYELTEPLLTVIAGVALVCTAKKWAKKISRDEEQAPG